MKSQMVEVVVSRALDVGIFLLLGWSLELVLQGKHTPVEFAIALMAAVIVQTWPQWHDCLRRYRIAKRSLR